MEETAIPKYYSTNARVYYAIAREAFETMKEDDAKNIRPRSDGQPGFVKTIDPEQKTFKNALVCVVFCGAYLEAMLHVLIGRKLGIEKCKELDRELIETKLEALGCTDQAILDDAGKYRSSRKEVVHEKSMIDEDDFKIAQTEAAFSFDLVERIRTAFGIQTKGNYKRLWD
jgi:hypothetical protein